MIRFEPVAELKAGGLLVYRVRVQAKKPGQFRLHVEVATPAIPKPMTKRRRPRKYFSDRNEAAHCVADG